MGLNPFTEWIGDKNHLNENWGEGKQYPFGLSCNFKVLLLLLRAWQHHWAPTYQHVPFHQLPKIFDCSTCLSPFLLLDGHGSRFDIEFLEYINAEETKWNVDIGLPYGTSYWQVGDTNEQNGSFKMKLTKVKKDLTPKKQDAGLVFEVDKRDVVKLVRESWSESFA